MKEHRGVKFSVRIVEGDIEVVLHDGYDGARALIDGSTLHSGAILASLLALEAAVWEELPTARRPTKEWLDEREVEVAAWLKEWQS